MDSNKDRNPNICTFKSKNKVNYIINIVRLLALVFLMLSFSIIDPVAENFVSYIAIFICLILLIILIVALASLKSDDHYITVRLLFFDFQKINYTAITKLKYSLQGFSIFYKNNKGKEKKLRTFAIETTEVLKNIILRNNNSIAVEPYNGIMNIPISTLLKTLSIRTLISCLIGSFLGALIFSLIALTVLAAITFSCFCIEKYFSTIELNIKILMIPSLLLFLFIVFYGFVKGALVGFSFASEK